MASSSPRSAALFGRRRRSKPGAAPGTLSVGPGALKSALRVLVYDETGVVVDRVLADPGELDELPLGRAGRKLWLDVSGLADLATLRALAARFDLHPLALEDAVHTHQRPKIEAYPKHLFVVLRMLDERDERLGTEQISLFLTDDAVITMQERPGDCFDPVRRRLNDPERLIRRKGPDYLAYALMDAVVDFGFPVLERIGDRLEELEEASSSGRIPTWSPSSITAGGSCWSSAARCGPCERR